MRFILTISIILILLASCNGQKPQKVHYSRQIYETVALDRIISQYPDRKERDSLYSKLYQKYDTDSTRLAQIKNDFFRYSDDLRPRLKKLIEVLDSLKKVPRKKALP